MGDCSALVGRTRERFPDSPHTVSLPIGEPYQMGAFREGYGILPNNRFGHEDLADGIFTGWPNVGGASN